MQNYILYTNHSTEKNKIPFDIRSEVLFREAEDCFYYFFKTKSALKKLNQALGYYPYHFKSLMLKGDIMFSDGNYDEALKLYANASEIRSNDVRVLGSIANCLNELKFYSDARLFCDKALAMNINDELYSSVFELKVKIEMNLRNYGEVRNLLNTNFVNTHENLIVLKNILSKILDNKIELKKKLSIANLRAI